MTKMTMTSYGGLPAVQITAPDGAEAVVTLFGAHLVSWKTAEGRERLFVSRASAMDGQRAIRGGVPVIFPQFNERGPYQRHGYARLNNWRLTSSGVSDGEGYAVFALGTADLLPEHAAAWPFRFGLQLCIAVRGSELHMRFQVRNEDDKAWSFSSALHTYHAVDNVKAVRITGVQDDELTIGEKLDQIFRDVSPRIVLRSGAGELELDQDGFRDAVVWNPGAEAAAALTDMADEEYEKFVCIEPAVIEPVVLQAGEQWCGNYRVRA